MGGTRTAPVVDASSDMGAAVARGLTVTLLSPGLVAAGAGLRAPGVRPAQLLQPDDVAAAVRWVVGTPAHV